MISIALSVGSRYPVNRKFLRGRMTAFLQKQGVEDAVVSVSIVGTRRMTELNEGLMKHEGCTDVLSFPQKDPEQPDKDFPELPEHLAKMNLLGDIVICFPEAVNEARRFGKMVDEQIAFLAEHGLLHLLGVHHD